MPTEPQSKFTIKRLLTLTIGVRLLVDTGVRMLYPFLPIVSRGLGISLVAGGSLMTLRTAVGLIAPWGGVAIDRFGVKRVILFGMAAQAAGTWWLSVADGWVSALGPVILLGIPMAIVVPGIQVLVSDIVPYAKRGRILGAVEFSWAATNLFIIPLVGLGVRFLGWQAPFFYLGMLTAVGMMATWKWFPDYRHAHQPQQRQFRAYISRLIRNHSALAVVLSGFFLFIGTESFFITYAAWLEQRFGFGPDQIGLVVGILGVTEWIGSGFSSAFIDRLGKRRGVLIGFTLASVVLICLPYLDATIWLAIAGLALYSLMFEFTIVSSIPLLSEQMPEARGLTLTMGVLAISLSRIVMAPVAAWLMESISFTATCTVGAIGTACGVIVLGLWAKENEER